MGTTLALCIPGAMASGWGVEAIRLTVTQPMGCLCSFSMPALSRYHVQVQAGGSMGTRLALWHWRLVGAQTFNTACERGRGQNLLTALSGLLRADFSEEVPYEPSVPGQHGTQGRHVCPPLHVCLHMWSWVCVVKGVCICAWLWEAGGQHLCVCVCVWACAPHL